MLYPTYQRMMVAYEGIMACPKVIGIFLCLNKNLVQFSNKDFTSFHSQVLFLTSHKRSNLMTYEFYIYRETPTPAVSVGIMLSRSKWESWELFSASGLQRRRNTHIRPLKHSRHSQDGCNLCWLKASHNSSSQAWGQHNWDKHSKNHYHFGEEMCTLTAKIPH